MKNLGGNRNQWQSKISRIFSKEIVTSFSPQISYLSFLMKSVVFS